MKRGWLAVGLVACFMIGARAQNAPPQEVEVNGDFEKSDPAHPDKPLHWERMDGLAARWTDAPIMAGEPPHGKAIRLDTSLTEEAAVASYAKAGLTQWVFPKPKTNAIAETYGVSLYSESIPVVPGKTYRVTFDYFAEKGTAGKLWLRGYAPVNGQMKRSYEGTVDTGSGKGWQHISGVFHPTKHTPNVTEMKIMLFAFYPPGVVWFDNIHVEMSDEPQDE